MGILEDGGLSPRKFKIMLDRSGRDHEAITASITASMEIVITESAPDKTERIVYVEVKTHTERSSNRKHLKLSNSQMVNAARHLENFLLLHVLWDKSAMQALGAELFSNPIRCIADGRLKNTFGEYVFKIA